MIGKRLSHFRILEKIGEGGMGVVYKALDEKLGRNVALKVLQPEAVGDEDRRLRFMREARAAAAVTHPHIATIHEIDNVGDQIFIAMELVEGKTLDRHLVGRPADHRGGLKIAIEIAEALARSHGAGVVHRDLKPQNIIVGSDGHSKVLDFGLAKLLDTATGADSEQAAGMQTVSAEMTREGKVLGTATYMSPEQARGLAVDARSDVFSFGVVLYEMFTGRLPFNGPTVTDTLSAILRDTPTPPSQQNTEVPRELERIIDKCLEKDPKDRYQHADDIVVDLRRLRRETDSVPISRMTDSGPVAAAPATRPVWRRPAAMFGGLALVVVVVVALVAVMLTGGVTSPARADVTGLAVLPFQNLKDVEDTQRIGQILQELIITDLSGLGSVTVYSSQRLKDIRKQLGEGADATSDGEMATQVARRAGANRMLTGSLSQLDSRWILTSQLIDVADGAVVRSERIDGADLYSMVDELSVRLRASLGVDAAAASVSIKDKTTDSMEAYEHYLAGLDELNDGRFTRAVENFEKAVEIDPKFGQAFYKLAIARWWANDGFVSADKDKGARTLEQALEDDVKLSERDRRLAEAFLPLLRHDYVEAVPGFEKLVLEYPDEKEAWYGLGEARWHSPGGSADLASIEPFVKTLELDPSFHLAYSHMKTTYARLEMHDQAIAQLRELIEDNPTEASWYVEWVGWLARKGDSIAVEGAIDESFDHISDPVDRRRVLTEAGRRFESLIEREAYYRRALDIPIEEGKPDTLTSLGWLLNQRGEMREAERAFSQALAIDPGHIGGLQGVFGVLKTESRLDEAILKARALTVQLPDMDLPFLLWIDAAISKGDEDETFRAIEAALGDSPDGNRKKWVWRNVAQYYLEIGYVTKAKQFAEMAYEASPDESDADLMTLLGRIAVENRDHEVARAYFEKANDTIGALYGLYDLGIREKKFDDVIRISEELKKRLTGGWAATAWISSHIYAGRGAEAERLLDLELESMSSTLDRQQLILVVADAYGSSGDLTRAQRLLEREAGLHADAERWWQQLTRAGVATRLGRYDEAAELLAATAGGNGWVSLQASSNELMRGDPARAESMTRDLVTRGPISRFAYEILAISLAEQDRFRDALGVAEKCVAMHADRDSYSVLAWVLVAGELDMVRGRAMAEAGRAIPPRLHQLPVFLLPQPPPEHALGLARLKQGRFAEAVSLLEAAAELRPNRALIQKHLGEARRAG